MKPKTKLQIRVAKLSATMPKISDVQIEWAITHVLKHIGHRTKKGVITCLDCGHKWQANDSSLSGALLGEVCPQCGMKIKIEQTRKRVFSDLKYYGIITICDGLQVFRLLQLKASYKVGEKPELNYREVIRHWFAPNGATVTEACSHQPFNYNSDKWCGWLDIRKESQRFNYVPHRIYPRQGLIPEVKRSGFKGAFYGLSPLEMFRFILSDSKAETLLKAKQYKLLRFFGESRDKLLAKYWPSVRICIRNGYTVSDASIWCDHIDLLEHYGKDLRSTKYVCPENLIAAHNRLVEKRRQELKRERWEKDQEQIRHDELKFREIKEKFFGLTFSDGLISVHVLESVAEYFEEGEAMHHCVYSGGYYKRPEALILSACIDGERVETVEVSLKTLKIVQSRGVCNGNTEHHDRIIGLVTENMNLIRRRIAA